MILLAMIVASIQDGEASATILFPVVMAIFGYVVMRVFVFDLADDVWLEDETLLVVTGKERERISLLDVTGVRDCAFVNPHRIILNIRPISEGKKSRMISFSPPRDSPFRYRSRIASELDSQISDIKLKKSRNSAEQGVPAKSDRSGG